MDEPGPEVAHLERVVSLVELASSRVIEVYRQPFTVTRKEDGSPLTEADLASHRILLEGLRELLPHTPVISEESHRETESLPTPHRFWLVDPLDGTKEFIRRTDEFTVNVALIDNGTPQLGVVSAPALGILYAGMSGLAPFRIDPDGKRKTIAVNRNLDLGLRVVGSRSHGDPERMEAYLKGRKVLTFTTAGSSLKFCRVAEGSADLYPRFGRTMEWDTAAGHAVLLTAGGEVVTLDGMPLSYGKPGLANPDFIARTPQAAST